MSASRRTLSAIAAAAAVAQVNAAMGPAFSTGPVSDDSFIRESWATLVLPAIPSDNKGDLSLWVGMGTSAGDLIQSIAENYGDSNWNTYAYTLMSTSDSTQTPVQTDPNVAAEGDQITMHYEYSDSTGNYTQTVLLNGEVVSSLSTSDGKAQGWGSAVECADETCGSIPAHKWINCSIILDSADTAYHDTLGLGTDVEATMTSDDGITWTIGTISIPGWDFSTESVTDSTASSVTTNVAAVATSSTPTVGGGASPSGVAASGSAPSGSGAPAFGSGPDGAPGAQPSGAWGNPGAAPSASAASWWGGASEGWRRSRISQGQKN